MITVCPPRTMRDVATSLVGSSFRRVQRDGRVTDSRRIMTLGQLLARSRSRSTSSTPPVPRT